ncbi:MAG: acetate--CoA ligase family protein [Acidobacteria bacterium]|nr:acetate--CoA ligase family protein [Acidobacteriota bacterium]
MSGQLSCLLRPRSIAVVGASSRPQSLGGRVTARLFASGYTGKVFLVNPRQDSILSRPVFPSVAAIPDAVDMALIIVPRDATPGSIDECLRKGIRGLVVITSGFREVGEEGRALEQQLVARCRAAGARMLGPNCMGLVNTHPDISMDATFSPVPALRGPIGFASQSGALGVAVLNICQERSIGFSQFVSMGNKADLTENDLLEAWEHDPDVPVIALYLESFSDPAGFLDVASRVSRTKPIVVVKAGKTAAGARAASSHTGALAGADQGAEALCRQSGVLRVETIEDMLDTALLLARCPLPRGPRVAVLTNAGGPAIMAADALDALGMTVGPLSDATRAALRELLPPEAAVGNPVDMIASAGPKEYGACLDLLLADPGVDAVCSVTVSPPAWDALDVLRSLHEVARRHDKPVVTVFMVGTDLLRLTAALPDAPPIFRLPEGAARALRDAWKYAQWRAAPETRRRLEVPGSADEVEAILARTAGAGGGYLPAGDAFRVLELCGLPVARWEVAGSAGEVLAAAERIGFPVALKAIAPDLVHKSDVGAIALDLRTREAVNQALDRVSASLVRAGLAGGWTWLVQEFRPGGREVIVGATRDPDYGPLIMFGLGGKYVEVFRDVQFGMAPLGQGDAERMVRSIRGLPLLTGTRGEAPADIRPIYHALRAVSSLAARHPAIAELDINPLLVYPEGGRAAVVDARIRVQ